MKRKEFFLPERKGKRENRFIQPGARCIGLSCFSSRIEAVAVLKPDGSVCVIATNRGSEEIPLFLRMNSRVWPALLTGDSISTIVVSPSEAG